MNSWTTSSPPGAARSSGSIPSSASSGSALECRNTRPDPNAFREKTPMTHAIRVYETGGPEVMRWEPMEPGKPGPGEVLVRNTAVGVNFVDVYNRSGHYPMQLPAGLG